MKRWDWVLNPVFAINSWVLGSLIPLSLISSSVKWVHNLCLEVILGGLGGFICLYGTECGAGCRYNDCAQYLLGHSILSLLLHIQASIELYYNFLRSWCSQVHHLIRPSQQSFRHHNLNNCAMAPLLLDHVFMILLCLLCLAWGLELSGVLKIIVEWRVIESRNALCDGRDTLSRPAVKDPSHWSFYHCCSLLISGHHGFHHQRWVWGRGEYSDLVVSFSKYSPQTRASRWVCQVRA